MKNSTAVAAKPLTEQLQVAVRRIEKFSPAPSILARAMMLMRDDQCEVSTVASLIRNDTGLAADILRISNSVYFGAHQPSQSVDEALQTIGFAETMRLLTLAVSRIMTSSNLDNYCISAEDFWAESLFNGLFMEQLAQTTGGADPAEAYTCGLLRYLGRLAINQAIHDIGGGLFWVGLEPLSQWEQNSLGFTHAQVGADLLRKWKFPEELVIACEGQECPGMLKPPSWMASALFFISSVLPQTFDQPFVPVRVPATNTDFMHPNALTEDTVEQAFQEACIRYREIREELS